MQAGSEGVIGRSGRQGRPGAGGRFVGGASLDADQVELFLAILVAATWGAVGGTRDGGMGRTRASLSVTLQRRLHLRQPCPRSMVARLPLLGMLAVQIERHRSRLAVTLVCGPRQYR